MNPDVREVQRPPWLVADHPPLTSDQMTEAEKFQIIHYPQVVRDMVDPAIPNQQYTNVSFMLFKEPKTLKTGKKAYGFVKMRGTWADDDKATREARKIVETVDSKFQIRVAPTGHWVPISDDDGFCRDLQDVTSGQQRSFRDEAAAKYQEEQRKIMNEIREREDQLKSKGDIYDDPLSIDFYIMKRVTEMKLTEQINAYRSKLDALIETRTKQWTMIRSLEKANPSHTENWLDVYNKERRSKGFPDWKPSDDQFSEFDTYRPENVPDPNIREIRGYDLDKDGNSTGHWNNSSSTSAKPF